MSDDHGDDHISKGKTDSLKASYFYKFRLADLRLLKDRPK